MHTVRNLALCGLVAGCSLGGLEDASVSRGLFSQEGLSEFSPDDRAYVQGHALAVYLYGTTLPAYVGDKGYAYAPGKSSLNAAVPYDWNRVIAVRSGGVDGHGTSSGPAPTRCDGDDVCPGDPGDGGSGSPEDGDPIDPDDTDPYIDEDCETFLDPAAMDARELARQVNPVEVLDGNTIAYQDEFERGLAEALYLEDLDEDTAHSEVEHLKDDVQDYGMCDHSPLVLDLNGDGVRLGPVARGVQFDLRGTGAAVRTSWPIEGDALLARDIDGDGVITSGKELFGNGVNADGTRYANGFDRLKHLDLPAYGGDNNGLLDARDGEYASLRLWINVDQNGISGAGELHSLNALGVVEIPLSYVESGERDQFGNRFAQMGRFLRRGRPGGQVGSLTEGELVNVWFRYTTLPSDLSVLESRR